MKTYTRDDEKKELEDLMIEYGFATEEEINLVCNINGDTLETMESILYARTALRNLEQLKDDLDIPDEEEDEEDVV